ncbi:UNVERIFIED_CONTAM: hypothetical protein GTU68_039985, partial [Idotea baltica]|nr:hypothetical protein [Idotea baltica]
GSKASCSEGEVLNVDGSCARPEVSRKIFVYTAPERPFQQQANPIQAPKPKLNYNIVFVRTPEGIDAQEPVVVPPPQQKTIVYVLKQDSEDQGPQMIEVPAPVAHNPKSSTSLQGGENPQLPIGATFRAALSSAINQQGQSVGGGAVGGGSGGSGFAVAGGSVGGSGGFIAGGGGSSFGGNGGSGFAFGGGSVGGSGGITTGGGSFGGNSGFTSGSGSAGGSGGFAVVGGGSVGGSGGFVSDDSNGGFVTGGASVGGSGGFVSGGASQEGNGGQGFQSSPPNLYSTPQ